MMRDWPRAFRTTTGASLPDDDDDEAEDENEWLGRDMLTLLLHVLDIEQGSCK